MGVVDDLERAREAYERREWVSAYDALTDADPSAMTAHDFARLATAAYLVGRRNDCIQALQRAYQLHMDQGQPAEAIRAGYWLAMVLMMHGEAAVGGGWVARCQRLIDDLPDDVVERGYVLTLLMFRHIFSGEYEAALDLAADITDYGRRFNEADLVANGLNAQGRMHLYSGRVREGVALLDEAMIGIATGSVSPIFAGEIYCSLIEACQEISDYGRCSEWTRALTSWIETQPGLVPFTGQCAVHRGQIMRIRGAFSQAIEEFERAMQRYQLAETPAPAGLAMAESGEVHRILGDLDAADAAYERAIGFGHEPQPGLALLWLARGRDSAAINAVRRLLGEPRDPVHRSQLLPGAVEVLLATGHVDDARAVVDELVGIADSFGCDGLSAIAYYARGKVRLALGETAAAVPDVRRAMGTWRALDAPYEVARCQLLLGRALRDLGDEDSAVSELAQARRTFHELGATPAEHEAARLVAPTNPGGLTEREVEVLRLVAGGKSNPEIAAALVLSEKTVARHLSNIFAKINVTSRTAAAAFAFEHKLR